MEERLTAGEADVLYPQPSGAGKFPLYPREAELFLQVPGRTDAAGQVALAVDLEDYFRRDREHRP